MGKTLAEKIIQAHLLSGEPTVGNEIGLRIDQTLTQDATGTMAYLAFEAMNIRRVKTQLSVSYVDHNTLQCGYENADDHRYLQSAAAKYGIYFSRPGNGICHQLHLERFGAPGKTLIGSDSHTPTAGGLGMLAFGAGGMDVAVAMGGGAYYITMPKQYKIHLTGSLQPHVTAKDAALELLRILSVKGGVNVLMEWGGPGVRTLTVPQRATIANMGAELGATTTIFPSDEQTLRFLTEQGRAEAYVALEPDADAHYDRIIHIDLSALKPLMACPHSPDNIVEVSTCKGMKVDQICIGSCTNSSLQDLQTVAAILKGKVVAPNVSLGISPGSRQTLEALADCGALSDIIRSGARILECACGPCIGMGFAPNAGGVSLRTFNRNFKGRSGTADAQVYLVSPETAAYSALAGYIVDPSEMGELVCDYSGHLDHAADASIVAPLPEETAADAVVLRGENIKPFTQTPALEDSVEAAISIKLEDNITTDHIMPAGAKILPYRSNIPKLAEFCFEACDPEFSKRALALSGSVIVAGSNYGQGSSREHAALVPQYLGVRCVIAKSFARIHRANLINAGIIPLEFADPDMYENLSTGQILQIGDIRKSLTTGKLTVRIKDTRQEFDVVCDLTARQRDILLCGGLLNYTRECSV